MHEGSEARVEKRGLPASPVPASPTGGPGYAAPSAGRGPPGGARGSSPSLGPFMQCCWRGMGVIRLAAGLRRV